MAAWTLERLPGELQAFLNETLPAIVRREVQQALAAGKNIGKEQNPWLRRKDFVKFHGISSSTLDRRVLDGSVEKDLSFGAGAPRYRLQPGKNFSRNEGG